MATWTVTIVNDDRSRSHEVRTEATTAAEALESVAQRLRAAGASEPHPEAAADAAAETSTPADAGKGTSL